MTLCCYKIVTVVFLFECVCSLTIPVLNMLLNELLCVSRVPPGVKHVDLDLSSLPPTTAMAVLIYNRWSVTLHYMSGLCVTIYKSLANLAKYSLFM